MLYFCGVCALLTLLLIDISKNNILVRSSIIPEQVIPKGYPTDIFGTFVLNFKLFNYNAKECDTSVPVKYVGIQPVDSNTVPSVVARKYEQNATCDVTWTCTNCKLTGVTQLITFNWTYPFAMATAINYTVWLPHFYTNSQQNPFLIQEQLVPPSTNLLFRGATPTELSMSLLRSYYTQLAPDYLFGNIFSKLSALELTRVGYVATRFPSRLGSTVSSGDFENSDQGLIINVQMSLNANVLMINEEARSSVLEFLSKLFALAGAVSSICIFSMSRLERLMLCIRKKPFKKQQAPEQPAVEATSEEMK